MHQQTNSENLSNQMVYNNVEYGGFDSKHSNQQGVGTANNNPVKNSSHVQNPAYTGFNLGKTGNIPGTNNGINPDTGENLGSTPNNQNISYYNSGFIGGDGNQRPLYPSEIEGMQKQQIKPQQKKVSIVAVHKNDYGIITDFKLSDGRVVSKQQAVEIAKTEGIEGVNVGKTRGKDHTEILRANPTNDPSKALDNLPTF